MKECAKCHRHMVPRGGPALRARGDIAGEDGIVKETYRGLCVGCLKASLKDGTVYDYPTLGKSGSYPKARRRQIAFLEDYHAFRDMGLSDAKIAANMGVQLDSLKRRLLRIARLGIVYTPTTPEEYDDYEA